MVIFLGLHFEYQYRASDHVGNSGWLSLLMTGDIPLHVSLCSILHTALWVV